MGTSSLEICAETLQACLAAREGGAHRIELCSGLSEGGLTPSHGLIRQAVLESNLPIHVMLRPRAGDFVYSASEFQIICADLEHAAELGAAGVVCGILREDRTVDKERTAELVGRASPMEVTFHRAFDQLTNLAGGLEDVIACGCQRLLSSGGKPTVVEGEAMLAVLVEQAKGRIRIAAGGGITVSIAASLLARTRIDLHTSLRRRLVADAGQDFNALSDGEPSLELQISDIQEVVRTIR